MKSILYSDSMDSFNFIRMQNSWVNLNLNFYFEFIEFIWWFFYPYRLVKAFEKIMNFGFAIVFSWSIGSIGITSLLLQIQLVEYSITFKSHLKWTLWKHQFLFRFHFIFEISNAVQVERSFYPDALRCFLPWALSLLAVNLAINWAEHSIESTIMSLANYVGIICQSTQRRFYRSS